LTAKGRELGLVDDVRWAAFCDKMESIERESARLKSLWATPNNALGQAFVATTNEALSKEQNAYDLLKRPNVTFAQVAELTGSDVPAQVGEQIEIAVKYAGYIDRQQDEVSQLKRLEETALPVDFDYDAVSGLSKEITIKLKAVRPASLAQAGRIQGVTPAAVQLLLVTLKKQGMRKAG
jgi:tRNA uridine 5-carboxymethylaminomethyl modification enzyme